MKVGDKVICINNKFNDPFVVDDVYEINVIIDNYINIAYSKYSSCGFDLLNNSWCGNFYNYFITPEELRLLKLESL